jgi:hypothetical protein
MILKVFGIVGKFFSLFLIRRINQLLGLKSPRKFGSLVNNQDFWDQKTNLNDAIIIINK